MTVFIGYSALWMTMILNLASYHAWLLVTNLTTNEHMNTGKYRYLHDEYDDFNNPFDKGNMWLNIIDGLFPSAHLYYRREDILRAKTEESISAAVVHTRQEASNSRGVDSAV